MLGQLETLATNTTRRNQLALIKCLGNILKVWTVPEEQCSVSVFTKLAAIISSLLQIPKYVQLRTETLQVLDQSVKLLTGAAKPDLVEIFRSEVLSSLDGVIKDLGSDPATKTTARDSKTALNNLQGGELMDLQRPHLNLLLINFWNTFCKPNLPLLAIYHSSLKDGLEFNPGTKRFNYNSYRENRSIIFSSYNPHFICTVWQSEQIKLEVLSVILFRVRFHTYIDLIDFKVYLTN